MAMTDIHRILTEIYPLPAESEGRLTGCMEERHFPKGYRILTAGRVEPDIYFMLNGICRIFCESNGKEVSFWFGREGDTLLSFESCFNERSGYETVELMEDSILLVLRRDELYRLYGSDIHIANWGRKFAERELLKVEKRMISLLSTDATERYNELIDSMPDLLQRIPLGLISSYLGVTQTTLSRIRAKIR